MMNLFRWQILTLAFVLAGCASNGQRQWTTSVGKDVAIIAIEAPGMCIRPVETKSDFVMVRPDFQTVISQSCSTWDGMGDAAVVWVSVPEDYDITADSGLSSSRQITQTAFQRFAHARADLPRPSQTLKDLLASAKTQPDAPIRIIGHTDSTGGKGFNETLGLKRARAVADWFVSRGIARDRIDISSAGEEQPLESNSSRTGRAANRRAETQITLIVTGA